LRRRRPRRRIDDRAGNSLSSLAPRAEVYSSVAPKRAEVYSSVAPKRAEAYSSVAPRRAT
jgi:hypothetical protein